MTPPRRHDLRNVAIIAHVDHGKTTLVDGLLSQAGFFGRREAERECFMDSGDLERERGITILAKQVAFNYRGVRITLIDTPGHADFGGEVERVLRMADGALLLVDAAEGPRPQTRFVLRKAFLHGLKPIVVINKIDRPDQRADKVLDLIFDLFIECQATDEQLDFAACYASGRDRYAIADMGDERRDLQPLFDLLIGRVPGPEARADEPLQLQIAQVEGDEYLGRVGIGRIVAGRVEAKSPVVVTRRDGSLMRATLAEVFRIDGVGRVKAEALDAGELAVVSGIDGLEIGDTICAPQAPRPMPRIEIERPTMAVMMTINTSPVSGRDGRFLTSRHLKARLERAAERDLALVVETTEQAEQWKVAGRGVLHLGILIETMRREGYELSVGRPEVLMREERGVRLEPVERALIEVPEAFSGAAMELFGQRQSELVRMENWGRLSTLEFLVPSRALIGLRTRLLTATRGEATLHHVFDHYAPFKGELPPRPRGVLVAMMAGEAVAYALDALQSRGSLFVGPGETIYVGMIVGEHCRGDDLDVNPCRTKHLTNIRAAGKDKNVLLAPPVKRSLEECLEYLDDDEWMEVTPKIWRLRKKVLDPAARRRLARAGG